MNVLCSVEDIPSIRVVFCGDAAVGKTNITNRLVSMTSQLIFDDNDLRQGIFCESKYYKQKAYDET